MADTSLGLNIDVKGVNAAVDGLNKIADGVNKTNSEVRKGAMTGVLLGRAISRGAMMAQRAVSEGASRALAMAEAVKQGAELPEGFSETGIAAVVQMHEAVQQAKDMVFKVFLEAAKFVLFIGKSIGTLASSVVDVVSSILSGMWSGFIDLGKNIGIFFSWIVDNFQDIAHNIAETLTTAFSNSIENAKRMFQALKDFATGKGWHLNLLTTTEGADIRQLGSPEFVGGAWGDFLGNASMDFRNLASNVADDFHDSFGGVLRRGEGGTTAQKVSERKLAEAVTRGSVADISTLNKLRAGIDSDSIRKQQLAEQKKANTYLAAMANVTQQELVI